jgi:hypothetical protein
MYDEGDVENSQSYIYCERVMNQLKKSYSLEHKMNSNFSDFSLVYKIKCI